MKNTQRVRELMQRLGSATRPEVVDLLPDMIPDQIGYAIDSMMARKELAPLSEPKTITTSDKLGRLTKRHYIVFSYVGQPADPSKGTKAAVQAKPSGYEPGYFTADIRASSWAGMLVGRA